MYYSSNFHLQSNLKNTEVDGSRSFVFFANSAPPTKPQLKVLAILRCLYHLHALSFLFCAHSAFHFYESSSNE